MRRRFEFGVRCLAGRVPGRSGTAGLVFYMSSDISTDSLRNVGGRGCTGKGNPQHGDPGPRRARISTSTEKNALARRLCFSPYFDRTFTTAHPTTGNFLGLGCRCSYLTESLQRAGAASGQPPRRNACTRKGLSIWTSYWKNARLSALAGDALRASPADEPADEQGSIEGLRLYFTPFTRPNFSGHQSFRERPRRLAFYRARAARAQPWTGVTDASSSCASGGTVPRRQETAAQEPRGRSTNTTSESPRRAAPN